MHPLDIFSDSPKYFIFQKETNKTNFGGVLTLLFSIIMIFFSILYLLDYKDMDKYSIEYSHIMNSTLNIDVPILNNITENNPNYDFIIELLDLNNNPLSENFIIYDPIKKEYLDRKNNYTIINRRISDFLLFVTYKCINKSDCSLREKDKSLFGYTLKIIFKTKNISLQNEPTPIGENFITHILDVSFCYKYLYYKTFDWEVIKYKEQDTLFSRFIDKKNEYISGHFSNMGETIIEEEEKVTNEKLIMVVQFFNKHQSYVEYKRKKKSLLDVIAKINSIFQFFHFCFLLIFKYYSKNFNNYKIPKIFK